MRLRLKWTLLLLLVSGVVWHYRSPCIDCIALTWRTLHDQRFQDGTTRLTTFRLTTDDWVVFRVPTRAVRLRALTNAALHEPPAPDVFNDVKRPGWRYSIDYQLLDETGEVVHESTYHFRASISQYRHPETEEVFSASFFSHTDHLPIQTGTLSLALDQYVDRPVHQIRIRLADHDPSIADVVVRVLTQQPRPDSVQSYTWTRLSYNRRARLSRSNVYTQDLLTDDERANMLRWQWQQAAPVGVAHTDFTPRFMYTLEEIIGEELSVDTLPIGFIAKSGLRATIPIPRGRGRVVLDFALREQVPASTDESIHQPESAGPTHLVDNTCNVSWFGIGPHQRSTRSVRMRDRQQSLELDVDGGLVEITSDQVVEIHARWRPDEAGDPGNQPEGARPVLEKSDSAVIVPTSKPGFNAAQGLIDSGGETDITPLPRIVQACVARPEQSIRYSMCRSDVSRQQGRHDTSLDGVIHRTAFRISVRNFCHPGRGETIAALPDHVDIGWSMLDENDEPIRTGTLTAETPVSEYDYIVDDDNTIYGVTDAADFYFNVPGNVKMIEFTAGEPVLVVGYTRPSQAIVRTHVPEDYHPFHRRQSLNFRWFVKRPVDHETITIDGNQVNFRIQSRPPNDNNAILTGNYDWEDFRPLGKWTGRFLLLPQPADAPMRSEAIASSYWELAANKTHSVRVVSDGRDVVQPKLIYSATSPARITVELDGKQVLDRTLRSSTGELLLPQITVDGGRPRRLVVRADDSIRVYISYLESDDAHRYLKRLAQIPGNGRLSFPVTKRTHAAELIMLRTFREETDSTRSVVKVRVDTADQDTIGPATGWTFSQRVYDLLNDTATPVVVLGSSVKVTASNQPCYVLLGEDMPPGTYNIDVECTDNSYVVLYRTTPGQMDRIKVYQQMTGSNE